MKMRYKKEIRWKVCKRVHVGDLQDRLNRLTGGGWTIKEIVSHSAFMFSVIAHRSVRVKR